MFNNLNIWQYRKNAIYLSISCRGNLRLSIWFLVWYCSWLPHVKSNYTGFCLCLCLSGSKCIFRESWGLPCAFFDGLFALIRLSVPWCYFRCIHLPTASLGNYLLPLISERNPVPRYSWEILIKRPIVNIYRNIFRIHEWIVEKQVQLLMYDIKDLAIC